MRLPAYLYVKVGTASLRFQESRSNTESVRVNALTFSAEVFFAWGIPGYADTRYWPIASAYSPGNGSNHPFKPSAPYAVQV